MGNIFPFSFLLVIYQEGIKLYGQTVSQWKTTDQMLKKIIEESYSLDSLPSITPQLVSLA